MKKYTVILLVVLLIAALSITMVACDQYDENGLVILDVPKVTVSGNTVSWDNVNDAEKYGVVVGEKAEVQVTGTSYTVFDGGKSVIKVRAIGDLKKYGYSNYSSAVDVTVYGKLATPSLFDLDKTDTHLTITWGAVAGAIEYELYIYKDSATTILKGNIQDITYNLPLANFVDAGNYIIKVKAIGDGKILNSEYSEQKSYSKVVTLSAPVNVAQKGSSTTDAKFIAFDKVDNANSYVLKATHTGAGLVSDVISDDFATKNDRIEFNLDSFAKKLINPGTYSLTVKAVRKNAVGVYNDSEFVSVKNVAGNDFTVTYYDAPTNVKLTNSTISWNSMGEGLEYTLNYTSTNNSNSAADSTNTSSYDLSTSGDLIDTGIMGGLVVNVNVFVKEDYLKGILRGKSTAALASADAINIQYIGVSTPKKVGDVAAYAALYTDKHDYYAITNISELNYIMSESTAKYLLVENLDAKGGTINAISNSFSGVFDGNNCSINKFTLLAPTNSTSMSLFGEITTGAVVKDLGVFEASIEYKGDVTVSGAILANINNGTVNNITYTGNISVNGNAGGLVVTNNSTIINAFGSVKMVGYNNVGGAIAINSNGATADNIRIFDSNVEGSKIDSGELYVGGLIGSDSGTVKYLTANKTSVKANMMENGNAYAGGLIGRKIGGSLNESGVDLRTATVSADASGTGKSYAAGLVGYFTSNIDSCYVVNGKVVADNYASGLVGRASTNTASIKNSYTLAVSLSAQHKYVLLGDYSEKVAFSNVHYFDANNYSVAKEQIENAKKVADRSQMKLLPIGNMVSNPLISDGHMVLKKVLYFEKDATFAKAELQYSSLATRASYTKVYRGDSSTANEVPSVKAKTNSRRLSLYSYDSYVTMVNEIQYCLNRVYKIK